MALVLGVLAACLNPMPDDFPNERDNSEQVDGQAGSTGLSGGGDDDGQVPIGEGGGTGSPETPPYPGQGTAGGTSAGSGSAGAAGAGGAGDAGCGPDAGPDAGAADAGCATETDP